MVLGILLPQGQDNDKMRKVGPDLLLENATATSNDYPDWSMRVLVALLWNTSVGQNRLIKESIACFATIFTVLAISNENLHANTLGDLFKVKSCTGGS